MSMTTVKKSTASSSSNDRAEIRIGVSDNARELTVEEVRELSFGRPLSLSVGDGIVAGISVDNELIALLKNESDKAKPVAVFAAAH